MSFDFDFELSVELTWPVVVLIGRETGPSTEINQQKTLLSWITAKAARQLLNRGLKGRNCRVIKNSNEAINDSKWIAVRDRIHRLKRVPVFL